MATTQQRPQPSPLPTSHGISQPVARQLRDDLLSPEVHGICSVTTVEGQSWAHCLCGAVGPSCEGDRAAERAKLWICDRLEAEEEIATFAARVKGRVEQRLLLRASLFAAAIARGAFEIRR